MCHRLFCLLLTLLLLLPAVPVAAQDDTPPVALCGDLPAEDCAILEASAEAMQTQPAGHFDGAVKIGMAGFPELEPDPLEIAVDLSAQYAMDEAAREAIRTMAALYQAEGAELAAVTPEAIQQLTLELYAGMDYDLQMRLSVPEAVAEAIGQDAGVAFPPEFNIAMRLVDGMAYFDLSSFRPMVPELRQLKADWIGFDMVGLLELSMEDAPAADAQALVESAAAGMVVAQLMESMQEFVEVERLENVALEGQDGAVFVTRPDLAGLFSSDTFRALVVQMAAMSATEADSPSPEELEQGLDMLGFMAPMLFRDLLVESTSVIGLDDFLLYESSFNFDWDLASLVQLAAMSDDSLADAVNAGMAPAMSLTVDMDYGGYDEAITVEAPEDVEIIPLDQMMPADTSAVF
jgi:hypothetical protein